MKRHFISSRTAIGPIWMPMLQSIRRKDEMVDFNLLALSVLRPNKMLFPVTPP